MDGGQHWSSAVRRFLLVGMGLAAVSVLAFVLAPSEPPGLAHSSVLNVIFDHRWIIGLARLLGLAAAAYLISSIVARAWHGQWVKQVGPVDTSSAVEEVIDDHARLQEELDRANGIINDLRAQLALAINNQVADTHGSEEAPAGGLEGMAAGEDQAGQGRAAEGPDRGGATDSR